LAAPITAIQRQELTDEQQKQQKLEYLTTLLADHEDAINKIMGIVGELNDMGVFDAADAMLQAKEKIAAIALGQIGREPVTNMINNLMNAAGVLTSIDPELAKKLAGSVAAGMDEGSKHLQSNKKISMFDLVRALNDPDFNRAIGFGLHFLKGLGKGLKDE
jgi:uncharacterized protein YjgD (DUF1641 family)